MFACPQVDSDKEVMSTIEKIDNLIAIANKLGYEVRYDYFGGTGGGVCEFPGKKILFMDLALTSTEQLEMLQNTLSENPLLSSKQMNDVRRAA